MSLKKAEEALENIGYEGRDDYDLSTSEKRFPDGAWYRMEISGVERPGTLEALINEREKRGIPVHRLISTVMGATLLDKRELKDFAQMAEEAKMEVILTPGPRRAWDTGGQISNPEGAVSGIRNRGTDQLRAVIADMMRAIEVGFKGFLVTDEGLLKVLSEMRENGDIPKDIVFKVSIYAGHGSGAGGKLLQDLGAGTFNPLGDLTLPQFSSIRKEIDIPIDIHIMLAESYGGFIRIYEGPEMARVASPCYFKIEPGPALAVGSNAMYKPWTDREFLAEFAREKVKYAQIIHEIIQEELPEAKLSNQGPADLAIPKT
jgi:hypothetical protein